MTNNNVENTTKYLYCIIDNTGAKQNPGWDVEIFQDNQNSRLAWIQSFSDIENIELRDYWVEQESVYGLISHEKALEVVEHLKLSMKLTNMEVIAHNHAMMPSPKWVIFNGEGKQNPILVEIDPVTGIVYNVQETIHELKDERANSLSVDPYSSIPGLTSVGGLYVTSKRAILRYIDETDVSDMYKMKVGHYYLAEKITNENVHVYTLDHQWIDTFYTSRFEAVTCEDLLETYPEATLNHPDLFSNQSLSSMQGDFYETSEELSDALGEKQGDKHRKPLHNPFSRISLEDRDWFEQSIERGEWRYEEGESAVEGSLQKLLDSEQAGWNEVERLSEALEDAQRENEIIRNLVDGTELGEALTELHEFYRLRYTAKENDCLERLDAALKELELSKREYDKLTSNHRPSVPLPIKDRETDNLAYRIQQDGDVSTSSEQDSIAITQLKEIAQAMSNSELNLNIALLAGHTEISEHEDLKRRQRNDYEGNGIVVLYGNHYILRVDGFSDTWAPCTDPASSKTAETWALKCDVRYIDHLVDVMRINKQPYSREWVAELIQATPRQRAEAAWITLQTRKSI